MNQLQINGKMSQGFGLKMKRKQQVEYRGNHSRGIVFLFQEVLEARMVSGLGGWGALAVRIHQKHAQATLAGKEGGCWVQQGMENIFNDSFVFEDPIMLNIPANEVTAAP